MNEVASSRTDTLPQESVPLRLEGEPREDGINCVGRRGPLHFRLVTGTFGSGGGLKGQIVLVFGVDERLGLAGSLKSLFNEMIVQINEPTKRILVAAGVNRSNLGSGHLLDQTLTS